MAFRATGGRIIRAELVPGAVVPPHLSNRTCVWVCMCVHVCMCMYVCMCDPLNESTVGRTAERTIRASSLSFNSVGVRISNSSAATARFLSEDDGGGCLMHEQESPHVVESARNRLYLQSPDKLGSM